MSKIIESDLIQAALCAVQALAKKITGESLVVAIDCGDRIMCEFLDDGAKYVRIPTDLSIGGRIEVRWITAQASGQPDKSDHPLPKLERLPQGLRMPD